ncbi:MAG: hypothetical protein WCB93_05815 [Gallionella sp.]
MKLPDVNPRLGIMATLVTGAILIISFRSIAIAAPEQQVDRGRINPEQFHERMQEHLQARLDRLAQRLEIKASQQAVWEDFAKSIESLPDWNAKKPGDDADAATIARYRANRASEMAGKLTRIADATARLQAALSEDQRKILNQTAQLMLHREHRFGRMHHDADHRGMDRGDPHPAS